MNGEYEAVFFRERIKKRKALPADRYDIHSAEETVRGIQRAYPRVCQAGPVMLIEFASPDFSFSFGGFTLVCDTGAYTPSSRPAL